MKVLIFGATGMVGQGVQRACLIDPGVDRVVTVGRAPSGRGDPKLGEIVLPDLFAIGDRQAELAGFDACFFCLGVSSLGMSEADYTRTTYDLGLAIARTLAPVNPDMTFVYVSGAGTDAGSRQMWARVKARTESDIAALPFKAVFAFRPGFIQPLHGARSKTGWIDAIYRFTGRIASLIGRFSSTFLTSTDRLGRAMIAVARHGYARPVLGNIDINAMGA
jgi:uncharacterized protein YbjT (DUF2867 family)